MRCGFELNEKLLLQENTGFLRASRIITHPCALAYSSTAWRPQKPDAEIDVVFGFSVKSGPYTAKISDDLHIQITYCTFVWIIELRFMSFISH